MTLRQSKDINRKRYGWIESARAALSTESDGLRLLLAAYDQGLGESLADAIEVIRAAPGRVILSGMGKSGLVARKIAATLSSTGTPALFIHPADASHGDLGAITRDDVVLLLSISGESSELQDIINHARRFAVPLLAMTMGAESSLAKTADVVMVLPQAAEACPNRLAPTTSSLLQMALGDALAVALLKDKGFSAVDFHSFHPGGKLGAKLRQVQQAMHRTKALPLCSPDTPMRDAIPLMTQHSFGCLGVTDVHGVLAGIITDGDLRRHMSDGLLERLAGEVMTRAPRTIAPDALLAEALELLNSAKITSLFVIDGRGAPIGLIHIHDLLRIGVA